MVTIGCRPHQKTILGFRQSDIWDKFSTFASDFLCVGVSMRVSDFVFVHVCEWRTLLLARGHFDSSLSVDCTEVWQVHHWEQRCDDCSVKQTPLPPPSSLLPWRRWCEGWWKWGEKQERSAFLYPAGGWKHSNLKLCIETDFWCV